MLNLFCRQIWLRFLFFHFSADWLHFVSLLSLTTNYSILVGLLAQRSSFEFVGARETWFRAL